MKYTKEEHLDIGRRIYNGEISRYEAAEQYGIGEQTARDYMRLYRDVNQLPPKRGKKAITAPSFQKAPEGMYGITRSMSRAGTPTDNAAMEAINGWIKAELFMDLHVTGDKSVQDEVDDYIVFFNEQRPAYSLNYLTPKQYRESYSASAAV